MEARKTQDMILVALRTDDIMEAKKLVNQLKGHVGGFIVSINLIKSFLKLFIKPDSQYNAAANGRLIEDFFSEVSKSGVMILDFINESSPGRMIEIWPDWALPKRMLTLAYPDIVKRNAEYVIVDSSLFFSLRDDERVKAAERIAEEIKQELAVINSR